MTSEMNPDKYCECQENEDLEVVEVKIEAVMVDDETLDHHEELFNGEDFICFYPLKCLPVAKDILLSRQ